MLLDVTESSSSIDEVRRRCSDFLQRFVELDCVSLINVALIIGELNLYLFCAGNTCTLWLQEALQSCGLHVWTVLTRNNGRLMNGVVTGRDQMSDCYESYYLRYRPF